MDISKYRDNIELSDICIIVEDHQYNLHKFPLSINSEYFKNHCKSENKIVLKKFPGKWKIFEQIADHCYGKEVDINEGNVILLYCASEFLEMNGKNNLIEKCEKFIDRLFRSVEYSKSLQIIIPFLESTKNINNDKIKLIRNKGITLIIDLWLRPLVNYKSSFKEKFFEDSLIFEELMMLNSEWIEIIINLCSSDIKKYSYLAKLAVEYIKINIINIFESNLEDIKNDMEKCNNNKLSNNSSSCSSLNEIIISDKSNEKDNEKIVKIEKKIHKNENIGKSFDKIILSLPDDINLGKIVSVYWLQKSFDICKQFKCKSKNKLLKLCSGMLTQFSVDEIKSMDPKNITELIEEVLNDDKVDKDIMKWIWDNKFLEMANNNELDPNAFSKIVNNMPESQEVDPDVVFEIVLSTVEKMRGEKTKCKNDLIGCVKLLEISPENLEVALESKLWEVEDLCKVAITRLKEKCKDTNVDKVKLKPYSTRNDVGEEYNYSFSGRYSYFNKNLSSWKSQSFTSHLNSYPSGDDDDYIPKSYEPISSYYLPYKCSTYSSDHYQTLEDNLKYELKKISDSYISYYKDRFPLKSRRRYYSSIPYDV